MQHKILLVDNYDSFTYNLLHLIKEAGGKEVEVCLNDRLPLEDMACFDKIVLSPGPGLPEQSGLLLPLVRRYAPTKSILGVCLGHQAIAEAFGARLVNLQEVYHGVSTSIEIVADDVLFRGLHRQIQAGRYHSWVVARQDFPDSLEITATDKQGRIMALRHRQFDVRGVQFHPESVLTPDGICLMRNWLEDQPLSD